MYLSFETNELSTLDLAIIKTVAEGAKPTEVEATPATEATVTTLPVAKTEESAARKAKAKAEAEAKAKAAAAAAAEAEAAAEPEPVVEETVEETVEEDLVGGEAEPEPEGPTMADAVAAATKLVSSGGAPKVKQALGVVGAKRVSEVPADQITAFLAALAA